MDRIGAKKEENKVNQEKRKSEIERRESAQAHAGEIVEDSGILGTPRLMSQMVSVRLDGKLVIKLWEAAERRGVTLSEILREGARLVLQEERAGAESQAGYRIDRIDGAKPRIASSPDEHLDEHLLASAL
jgi:hypothetical protein